MDLALDSRPRRTANPAKGKTTVDSPGSSPLSRNPRRPRRHRDVRPLVTLIKAVLAGVGGVYLATGSVAVTVVAAGVAVLVVALVLVTQR